MNDHAFATQVTDELDDLLKEVAAKNHVMIVKYKAREVRGKTVLDYEGEHVGQTVAFTPALARQDRLRVLAGRKPLYLAEAFKRVGGDLRSVSPNTRTNQGVGYVSSNLAGTNPGTLFASVPVSVADTIGLSNNTAAVAATDTASVTPWSSNQTADAAAGGATGEMTYGGMTRHAATMAQATSSTAAYTATYTWTATGTVTAAQKAGLFGGSSHASQSSVSSTNVLFLANTFTSTTLANNDQLSLTWTVNI